MKTTPFHVRVSTSAAATCHEKGDGGIVIITVKNMVTLLAVGACLLVTLSACEQARHSESMSAEDLRAQAQESADPADGRIGGRPGVLAKKDVAPATEPEPAIARLDAYDLVPEKVPQPNKLDNSAVPRTMSVTKARGADVFFDLDKHAIRPEAVPVLEYSAELLKQNDQPVSVLLEGHCDELGTAKYNLALGIRRAQAVKKYLVDLGVEASRIRIVSYGKEKPFCTESTPRCRQQNRRVHFVWPFPQISE